MSDNAFPHRDTVTGGSKTVNQAFGSDVTTLVALAALAPSSHNTQPWRFRTSDSAIGVFADRTRALPVNDPEDRELPISCGCALFNLRAAAVAADVGTTTSLLPAPDDADWLARLSHEPRMVASSTEAELARQMERRRTYRRTFQDRAVERTAVERLVAAATAWASAHPWHVLGSAAAAAWIVRHWRMARR